MEDNEIIKQKKQEYKRGFTDGLACYAHWKNGEQLVGTLPTLLKQAIEEIEHSWNYLPPTSIDD